MNATCMRNACSSLVYPVEPIAPLAAQRQPQLELFSSGERAVLDRLRGCDPNQLPPLEALRLLAEMRASLEREER